MEAGGACRCKLPGLPPTPAVATLSLDARYLTPTTTSVVVVDFERGRWSVLGPEGRFVRHQFPTVRGWDRPGSSPILLGFFADGTALDAGTPVRLETLDADFVRADAEGEILEPWPA